MLTEFSEKDFRDLTEESADEGESVDIATFIFSMKQLLTEFEGSYTSENSVQQVMKARQWFKAFVDYSNK